MKVTLEIEKITEDKYRMILDMRKRFVIISNLTEKDVNHMTKIIEDEINKLTK